MRLFYDNLIDASGVGFAASSAQTDLPVTNLADEHKGKVWRTGTSTAAESVVFDLLTAQTVTSIIVFNHTLLGTDSAIVLYGNATDAWGSPSFTQTLTWMAGPIEQTFASQSYRYWKLAFTKASAGVTRDIGRIFLGPYTDVSEQFDFAGFDEDHKDLSVEFRSIGGQTFTDTRDVFRLIDGQLSYLSAASADLLRTLMDTVQTHTPFWFIANSADAASLVTGECLYVKFAALPKLSVSHYDGSEYLWDAAMKLEEQL